MVEMLTINTKNQPEEKSWYKDLNAKPNLSPSLYVLSASEQKMEWRFSQTSDGQWKSRKYRKNEGEHE